MVDKNGVPWAKYRTPVRLKPLMAVRHKCLDCYNELPLGVKLCYITGCPLHPYRFGRNPVLEIRAKIPGVLRSMRLKCLDCATTPRLVEECWVHNCPLHHYRFGKNPGRAGIGGRGGPEHLLFGKK